MYTHTHTHTHTHKHAHTHNAQIIKKLRILHTSVNATVIAPFQSCGRDVTFKLTDLQPKMASHAASREMLVKGGSALLERICSKRPLRQSVLSTMRPIYYNLLMYYVIYNVIYL